MKSNSLTTSTMVSFSDIGAVAGITRGLHHLSSFVGTIADPDRINQSWKVFLKAFAAIKENTFGLSKRRTDLLLLSIQELHASREALEKHNRHQEGIIKEKDWLLREIHHRVKNNLQMSMSLLNLQASTVSNKDAQEALTNSQRRMQSMALLHQKLYQSESIAEVDMGAYTRDLVNYLKDSFDDAGDVHFDIVIQDCMLGLDQAVPLGLILNEAITNSFKYAFPNKYPSVINIKLSSDLKGSYCLCISDNGIGIPVDFGLDGSSSLGMRLMNGLTNQLNGKFDIRNNNGTKITVSFKDPN